MSELLNPVTVQRDIPFDTTRMGLFAELYEEHYSSHLYNALADPDSTERLLKTTRDWRTLGSRPASVVLTAGVYDLLHLDHTGYLLHTKSAGAQRHFETFYSEQQTWDELDPKTQENWIRTFLSRGELKLIVSVDGDTSVAASKGFNAEKGNSARPIFSWDTRARSVANVNIPITAPDGSQTVRPVADAITVHGPHDFDKESPHHDMVHIASYLQPDVWAIYGEAIDTLEDASTCSALGGVALKCIPFIEGSTYFEDRLLGGKFSTTKIINRARGEV